MKMRDDELKIGDAAEFRMYASQLQAFDKELDKDKLREALTVLFSKFNIPQQYVELFKMCCDLDFVIALGSAGVSHCHDRDNK